MKRFTLLLPLLMPLMCFQFSLQAQNIELAISAEMHSQNGESEIIDFNSSKQIDSVLVKMKWNGETYEAFFAYCEGTAHNMIFYLLVRISPTADLENPSNDSPAIIEPKEVKLSGKVFDKKGKRLLRFRKRSFIVAFTNNYAEGFIISP